MTCDTRRVTGGGGAHYKKISAPYLLGFGNAGLMKILSQIMTDLITDLTN